MFSNCLDMVEGLIVIGHQFLTKELLDDDNDVFLVQHKLAMSSIHKIAIVKKKNTSFRSTTNATKKFVEKPKMLKARKLLKKKMVKITTMKTKRELDTE